MHHVAWGALANRLARVVTERCRAHASSEGEVITGERIRRATTSNSRRTWQVIVLIAAIAAALLPGFATNLVHASTAADYTIWSPSTLPEPFWATEDSGAVELGVKFRTDVAGTVKGIRFYKGPGNTGTHIGNLWTATGSQLASATFVAETASGWQQVNFTDPVTISANTNYVASYFAPAGQIGRASCRERV